jgi:acetamidase/formamidase
MTPSAPIRVPNEVPRYGYDAFLEPLHDVEPGATLIVGTLDARAGALSRHRPGELFELPPPPEAGNPLTGPIRVRGACPGDALVVSVESIEPLPQGWVGGHAGRNCLPPGRVPESLGRMCHVEEGTVRFSEAIAFPIRPMIGCIGTAPGTPVPPSGAVGSFGGNLDHPPIGRGARVFLPVHVEGAMLYLGDVHAAQGDGELSAVAVEASSEVTLTVSLESSRRLTWPWIETADRLMVATAAADFAEARREAVEAMLRAVERCLGLQPAEGLALISAVGDLRIGQAAGGMDLTLRLEIPRFPGLGPVGE